MSFRKRTLVQDAGSQTTPGILPVKDDMPAALHATQSGANIIAGSAQRRIIGEHLATRLDIVKVLDCLAFAPGTAPLHWQDLGQVQL